MRHGEESVGDIGEKAVDVQELPPTRLLLGAPQQHWHHTGEELLAPSLWWRPPAFRLERQSGHLPALRLTAPPLPALLPGRPRSPRGLYLVPPVSFLSLRFVLPGARVFRVPFPSCLLTPAQGPLGSAHDFASQGEKAQGLSQDGGTPIPLHPTPTPGHCAGHRGGNCP